MAGGWGRRDGAAAERVRRVPPPLDRAALEALALRYVERFATTRGKLAAYLGRKVRERGWDGEPADPVAIAERFATLGYVDDRGYADAKAGALARRGYGARRVADALRAARVTPEDAAPAVAEVGEHAEVHALAFARRRRFGPFATAPADERTRSKQLAAMLRAGHPAALSRKIVSTVPGEWRADD